MKILVTGGAGYVGSHVVYELLKNNFIPVVYDNLSLGDKNNVPQEVEFIEADIRDGDCLKTSLTDCVGVIHLAALKAAGDSMFNPEQYADNNINGSITLLNAMSSTNTQAMIFSSSAAVYGAAEKIPVDETAPINPINFYGYNKRCIEEVGEWYAQLGKIKFSALRYFNVVGYDVEGKVRGLEKNPNNLLPVLMEKVKGIRKKFEIFGDDYDTTDGTCIRDYIHVNDLANAHVKALIYLINQQNNFEVFNLGSAQGFSVKEMVDATERISGKKVNAQIVEKRKGDMAKLICDYSKAKKILGWEPKYSNLETIIKTTLGVYEID